MPTPVDSLLFKQLTSLLRAHWRIHTTQLEQTFRGHAHDSWTFRADAVEGSYFLKLKSEVSSSSVLVADWLWQHGIPVSAPLRALDGTFTGEIAHRHLLVFPWITGFEVDLATLPLESARTVGSLLKAVHSTTLPNKLRRSLEHETFLPWGEGQISRVSLAVTQPSENPFRQRLTAFLAKHPTFLAEYLHRVQGLGQAALRSEPIFCLCHNDFQSHNLLTSDAGDIRIMDWDNPVWAPPEVDLLHLPAHRRPAFEAGYGPLPCNAAVVAYLQANWLLQETFDCIERLLFSALPGAQEQQWAWSLLESMLPRMQALL